MTGRLLPSTGATGDGAPVSPWPAVRREMEVAVERLLLLLSRTTRPEIHAIGEWSIAETAVHLSHAWLGIPALARRDLAAALASMPASEGLGTESGAVFAGPEELSAWTARGVGADPERDLGRLAQLIRDRARAFLAHDHDADDTPRPWVIEGISARPAMFGCHVLGETLVHGDDIARAAGVPWRIEPRAAALVLRYFLFEVLAQASLLDLGAGPRFVIDLRLGQEDRFHLVKDERGLRVEATSKRRVDVHVKADPADLLLLIWRRRNPAALMARGRLAVWGARPWKLRDLASMGPQV